MSTPAPPPAPRRHPRWLLPALAVAAVAGSGYYLFERESPADAWRAITSAAERGDYGAIYDRFDPASRGRMSGHLRQFADREAPGRATAMTDRERFALMIGSRGNNRAQFAPCDVRAAVRQGDRVSLLLGRDDPVRPGKEQVVYLTRVDGRWCLSYGADRPE